MNDLISIVLPVYNGAKFMRESIDSVLAQTYNNWELLIVDDCSTDESPNIAYEYTQRDPRIHYYRNECNLTLPVTLNRGFTFAKGEYLTWTSDDNLYRPSALEKMHASLLANPTAQFVFASCRIIDGAGKEIEYIMVDQDSKKRIVGQNSIGACFMYTRKAYEATGDYDPDLVLVEDFDYWQRICMQFDSAAIEEILYDYRRHDGALTSTMRKDHFNKNLEKVLIKNISGFGKLNLFQKYYYYKGLYDCRVNQGDQNNSYEAKYRSLRIWYYLIYQVPGGLRRRLKRLIKTIPPLSR